jgi:hypothetical protein
MSTRMRITDRTMQCYLSCKSNSWKDTVDDADCTVSAITSTTTRSKPHPVAMQRLHILLTEHRFLEFREELESAEMAGEISEFCAFICHALLAIVEGSEFANDYLEMAEAVVSSPYEMTIIAESLATYDSSQGTPSTPTERCLAVLDHTFRLKSLEQPIDQAISPAADGND